MHYGGGGDEPQPDKKIAKFINVMDAKPMQQTN